MVTAVFRDLRTFTVVTDEVWQFDYGQTLRIEGLDLDPVTEIDFSLMEHGGVALSVAGVKTSDGATEVSIPDIMLKGKKRIHNADYIIYVYVYETDEVSGETTHWIQIPVRARPAREDYGGSESEEDPFADAIAAVNEAAKRAEAANESAETTAEQLQSSLEQISANAENIANLQTNLSNLQEVVSSITEDLQEIAKSMQEDAENLRLATERISQNESDIEEISDQVKEISGNLEQHISQSELDIAGINSNLSELKETFESLGLSVVDGAINATYTES